MTAVTWAAADRRWRLGDENAFILYSLLAGRLPEALRTDRGSPKPPLALFLDDARQLGRLAEEIDTEPSAL